MARRPGVRRGDSASFRLVAVAATRKVRQDSGQGIPRGLILRLTNGIDIKGTEAKCEPDTAPARATKQSLCTDARYSTRSRGNKVTEPQTVLLVEDNPPDANIVRIILTDEKVWPGLNLITAQTLAEMHRVLDETEVNVDALLLDLHLPDGDAEQVLDAVHNLHLLLPIVVMTGVMLPGGLPTGVTAVIKSDPKSMGPILVHEIKEAIKRSTPLGKELSRRVVRALSKAQHACNNDHCEPDDAVPDEPASANDSP